MVFVIKSQTADLKITLPDFSKKISCLKPKLGYLYIPKVKKVYSGVEPMIKAVLE